jgi:hypothetical protein
MWKSQTRVYCTQQAETTVTIWRVSSLHHLVDIVQIG